MTGDVTWCETRQVTFVVKMMMMIQIGAKSRQVRGPDKLRNNEMSLFAAFAEVFRYKLQSRHYSNNKNTLRYSVR